MKEYYIVTIPNDIENLQEGGYFSAICKRQGTIHDVIESFAKQTRLGFNLFGNYYSAPVFEDLITGKKIYGDSDTLAGSKSGGCLIYKHINGQALSYEKISAEQTLKLLEGFTPEKIDAYKITLNELENKAILKHKQLLEEERQQANIESKIENFRVR